MNNILLLATIPGLILGTLNWLYWRRKGYKSFQTLFFSYCAFYGISVIVLRFFQ